MEKLTVHTILDDTITARLVGNQIHIYTPNKMYYMDYDSNYQLPDINQILHKYRGKHICIASSDVLDIFQQEISLINLEKKTLDRINVNVVYAYLPYLVAIADEINSAVLVQSIFEQNEAGLTISIGLVDDLQVILLELKNKIEEEEI